MNYEQKYKEALERAKGAHNSAKSDKENGVTDKITEYTIQLAETIFPELKVSDDERIRKSILEHIQLCSESIPNRDIWIAWLEKQYKKDSQVTLPSFTFDDILALQCCMETVKKVQEDKDLYEKLKDLHGRVYDAYQLEKQGEQKPIDKVEPKFHEGDFIKHNKANLICKVISVNRGIYYVEDIEPSGGIELFNAEQNFHLWTIKDAKDGELQEVTYHIPNGYHAEINGNAVVIKKGELINNTPSQDHWQDLRERAAIAVLQAMITNKDFQRYSAQYKSEMAITHADALVEKLKGE